MNIGYVQELRDELLKLGYKAPNMGHLDGRIYGVLYFSDREIEFCISIVYKDGITPYPAAKVASAIAEGADSWDKRNPKEIDANGIR